MKRIELELHRRDTMASPTAKSICSLHVSYTLHTFIHTHKHPALGVQQSPERTFSQ